MLLLWKPESVVHKKLFHLQNKSVNLILEAFVRRAPVNGDEQKNGPSRAAGVGAVNTHPFTGAALLHAVTRYDVVTLTIRHFDELPLPPSKSTAPAGGGEQKGGLKPR